MPTNWTLENDMNLVEAVESAIDAGYHNTEGPKRPDGYKPGFWNAVSIMMADRQDSKKAMKKVSPTPGACSKRFPISFDLVKNSRATIESVDVLKSFERFADANQDLWESIAIHGDELEQDMNEATHSAVMENNIMLRRVLKDLGVEIGDIYNEG